MNTDGVPVFKSSKVSISPLYLITNELPYGKRMATENMIFAELWFGEKKPAMWTFLKPHTTMGVEMKSPERGKFHCKRILLSCWCDLPARCLLCNSMQYNGENGCWKCLQPGETVRTSVRGQSRAFLYQNDNPKGPLRTPEGIRAATLQQQGVTLYCPWDYRTTMAFFPTAVWLGQRYGNWLYGSSPSWCAETTFNLVV